MKCEMNVKKNKLWNEGQLEVEKLSCKMKRRLIFIEVSKFELEGVVYTYAFHAIH